MATVITGLTGSIAITDLVQKFASVSINTGADLLDVSAYGGNGWRQRVAGIKDLAGSCVAFMTKDAADSDPFQDATGTMTITFATGCSIAFNAIIGSRQIVGEYQGLNIVTFNFAKDDDVAPTVLWDETP